MRLILVRLGLFAGSAVVLAHWPIAFFVASWALAIWLVPRAYRDRQEIVRLRGSDPVENPLVAELRSELQVAHAHIEFLQERLEEASQAPSSLSTRGHPLYRRVGLDQDCPKWVAEVVRREFRRRLNPDTKPPHQKAEADRRFKQAEEVFGEIWRVRGF
jgi:hypothetical protein